jgi:hypothetical protein
LLVPICKQTKGFDNTCLLGKGDHDFIHYPSFVFYAGLATHESLVLTRQVDAQTIKYKELLDEQLFARICAGVGQSRFSAPKFKAYFAAQTAKPVQNGLAIRGSS